MKKLLYISRLFKVLFIYLIIVSNCFAASAITYTLNGSPLATDQILMIDDPAGSWAINRVAISSIFGLLSDTYIPDTLTIGSSSTVALAALPANVQTFGAIAPSANVQSILSAATYAAIRTLLDLEAGTDFYSVSGADAAFEPLGVTESDITDLGTTAVLITDTSLVGYSWFLDEDSFASDSATKVASQQSIKAYIASVKLDDMATPDDNTDLDVSITRHGLCPKAPNDTEDWLRGDGTWANVPYKDYVLNIHITDLSSAGWHYIAVPYAGTVRLIQSVLEGSITVANAGLTFYVNGIAMTGGTITITQAGSAAGDYDYCEPTANNTVVVGDVVRVYKDGAATGAVDTHLNIVIER